MHPTGADDLDGLPVWECEAGAPLREGLLAVERLGVGHRTETWWAWSVPLWHPVIVKLARPHQVAHPRARRCLRRESTALAEPCHPALPRLLADGIDDALPHIVLEYVDGLPLSDAVDEHGALPPADVAMLGVRLLPPLLHLHDRGLAHLDVKSENVLIDQGDPVLVDCGSARELGRLQPPGKPVGTFGYAAPELEACEPIAATMDYYGLGTVLAEALTGQPFPGVTELPDTPVTLVVRTLLAHEPTGRGTPATILAGLAAACAEPPWPPCIGPNGIWPPSRVEDDIPTLA